LHEERGAEFNTPEDPDQQFGSDYCPITQAVMLSLIKVKMKAMGG